MAFDEGKTPATATVVATTNGTPTGKVYVGTTTPSGQPDPHIDHVEVQLNNSGAQIVVVPARNLSAGGYTGTLVLQACADAGCAQHYAGSPFKLDYSIQINGSVRLVPSVIALNAESGKSVSQDVAVTLPSGLTTYTVTAADNWASIEQQTSSGFRVTAPGRSIGTYSTVLTVKAGNSTFTLPVSFSVVQRQFKVSASKIDLTAASGNTAPFDLSVVQLAEAQSGITASVNVPWLTVSNVSASGLHLQASSLPSGTHSAELTVNSGAIQLRLPVTYTVSPPPGGDRYLGTSTTSLAFTAREGSVSAPQSLGLKRPSWNPAVTATFEYGQGNNWLVANTRSDNDIEVSVNAGSLAKGAYSANIKLTGAYPGTAVVVPVTVTVGEGLATPAAQTLVLGSDSTAASLKGSIPVRSNGAASVEWSATSNAGWLKLTTNRGSIGTDVAFEVDTAAALLLPAYADHQALVTISAPNFTSVQSSVTLRRELAEVHFAGPGNILAGKAARVIVRGRGFDRVANIAGRLSIAGAAPTSVSRLSATALAVDLPALAAGSYEMRVSNAIGATTSSTALKVLPEQAFAAAAVPTTGVPRSIVYDPVRQTVYSANETLSALRRSRLSGGSWITDSLAFPSLLNIGLSPDGATVIAVETSGKLHLIDAASFTVTNSYSAPGVIASTPTTGHGLAVTNDGKVWLPVGSGWNSLYTFDLRSREFAPASAPAPAMTLYGGPWFEVSRNGERLVMVQSASISPTPKMLYMDSSEGILRENPADLTFFYWSLSGLSDNGDRFLVSGDTVYDNQFARVGKVTLPDSSWSTSAALLSPDGRRVYVFALKNGAWNVAGSTTMPRIYVLDASAPAGVQTDLPVLGHFDLADYPTCRVDTSTSECFRPTMTIAPDGKTLFVLGSARLVVAPVPTTLNTLGAQRRNSHNMTLWLTGKP